MKNKADGLTDNKLLFSGLIALNNPFFPNLISSAVVAINEPRISKLALEPKNIPLGLIKNKFYAPSTPSFPNILLALLPVILVDIFSIPAGFVK